MTILITGIHGFVGTNLVATLKDRHQIYGLDIVAPEKDGVVKTFSWDAINISYFANMECLPDIDTIIHLAGKAHDTKNRSEATTYFEINTGLTKKIFDYFLKSNAKQFIFFSSVKAAADRVVETQGIASLLTEDIVPKPVGPYGESKIAAEEYIHCQLSTVNCPLKKVYILRPCMIHGPGNRGNLNLLYQVVSKGIPWPLGAFDNRRSFTNIWNLSWIVEQLIIQNPLSGIYHLADDEPLSTNQLIRLIAESKGKKARIWNVNKTFIKMIARIGDFCKLPLNSDRLKKLTENYIVSNQKLKKTLGVDNLPVDATEGMKKTLTYFQTNTKKH